MDFHIILFFCRIVITEKIKLFDFFFYYYWIIEMSIMYNPYHPWSREKFTCQVNVETENKTCHSGLIWPYFTIFPTWVNYFNGFVSWWSDHIMRLYAWAGLDGTLESWFFLKHGHVTSTCSSGFSNKIDVMTSNTAMYNIVFV